MKIRAGEGRPGIFGIAYNAICPRAWHPREIAVNRLLELADGRILSGPFAGMRYLTDSVGSVLEAKLLGTYEKELHGIVSSLARKCFDLVIDIGAAEGYYAVGLARSMPSARIIAFEMTEEGQALIRQLAEK